MERPLEKNRTHKRVGRIIGIGTVLAAIVLLFVTLQQTNSQPRTDDANVRANYIQMVAEVENIVRSIEDEKIQKEERDKTRDVFARIEGLD